VLVLIDGRPINSPRDGEIDLSTIPLDNIDRIEVMYGPGSSLYGSQAMGGTVNIITKNPPKEKQKTESTTTFGSFKEFSQRISQGARLKKLGYLLTGAYESDHGFRENSEFNAEDLNAKFDYQLNAKNDIVFNSGIYKNRVGVPGSTASPSSINKQKVFRHFFDLNWDFKPDDLSSLSLKAYQTYDRLEFVQLPLAENAIQTTKVRGINLQVAQELYKFYQLIMGLNYVQNLNDSTTSAKHYYDVWAFYMENQFEFFDRLKLTAGARVDKYSNFGTELDPSATLSYKLDENNRIRALISRSFRAPTFNDLYWPFDGFAQGNVNLRPERGVTVEAGFDTRITDKLSTGITYYRNDFSNLINWAPQSADPSAIWQPMNIDSAVINGIEITNALALTDNLEFDVAYTYLRAKNSATGKYLIYQPIDKVDMALKYKDKCGLACQVSGQSVDQRFDDPNNSVKVKKFFVVNMHISKKFKEGFTYFITLDNIFNARCQTLRNYPMPLCSMSGGAKVEF
jgi:outer membrane cobalamin receptor